MPDTVQHEELPIALTLLGLELSAVQNSDQFQDERVIDIGMLDFVVGINDDLVIWRPLTTRLIA